MNFKEFLVSKAISAEQLAEKLGCSRANVSVWVSGKSAPNINNVTRITDALNDLGAKTSYIEVFQSLLQTKRECSKEA